jgi:hypothetical protein
MEVGVANATEENLNLDVLRPRIAALDGKGCERGGCALRGKGLGGKGLRLCGGCCRYRSCGFTHEYFSLRLDLVFAAAWARQLTRGFDG